MILGVPVVGFGAALGIRAHFDSELRSAIVKSVPDADPAKVAATTVDRLCDTPQAQGDADFKELCGTNRNLGFMEYAAVGAGVAGLGLLALIWIAGTVARGSRNVLLYVFRPGLYLTAIALVGLVLVHAGLAIGAIYYGESILLGRFHIGIIATIGIGALLGVALITKSVFGLVHKARTVVVGNRLSRSDAPDLWKKLDQLADGMGALRPTGVVVGLEPNFFVTEADVICLDGTLTGRTLYCSLPLARILSVEEFDSVVGHELAHFKGSDTKFSEHFYPIYSGTTSSLAALMTTASKGGSGTIPLLPAIAVFSYFLESFSVAENRLGRERELTADREGAKITSPRVVATALVKVHAFAILWQAVREASAKSLEEGKAFINVSKIFAGVVVQSANPELFKVLDESHFSHPTDTHPPLAVRLEALGISLADITEASLAVAPSVSAIDLVPEAEKREEGLSDVFHSFLARERGISLPAANDQVQHA